MIPSLGRSLKGLAGLGLILHAAACGTILHPERKGQRSGRLDPGIVVLDAVGLLFFIVPGVIAFAVDFTNGTIYLPGGKTAAGKVEKLRFDPGADPRAAAEEALLRRTGLELRLDREGVEVRELRSAGEIAPLLASARQGSRRTQ